MIDELQLMNIYLLMNISYKYMKLSTNQSLSNNCDPFACLPTERLK